MKRFITILTVLLAFTFIASQTYAVHGDSAAEKFKKIKSLAGEWQGTRAMDDKTVNVTYELVSNGSTVMETLMPADEPNMVTMYHLNGDQLMMTHYCAVNNQPRMESVSSDDGMVKFELKDISNLAKPEDGHMVKMSIAFKDDDHITHTWTFKQEGKEMPGDIVLERKKMTSMK